MGLLAVYRGLGAGFGNGSTPAAMMNTMAHQVTMDWHQAMILDGRGFQVRAGTISVPFVGDVVITDTAAEMSVDCAAGTTIIPVYQNLSINLGTGTLHEYATKSVATVSSGGDAFVPLPLKSDGPAATTTARADAAGGVTVTAELATSTARHWRYSNPLAIVTAGGGTQADLNWEPAVTGAPVLVGARSLYTQVAATGTGPSYYLSMDYIDIPTVMVAPS